MNTPQNDKLLGTTLAQRYLIDRLVAEEMLGKVYVARDLQDGKLVQLKILHAHLVGNAEKFKRFGRELTATRMVRHPHTVQVLDWGHQGDLHYLVLEFLTGRTLAQELEKGPLAPDRVASITAQIANAIGAAHQEGIVHRNLGPTNILLLDNAARGDFVKVRDFGLSRLEKFGEEATTLTQAGARVGNVHYMPPEYIEEDRVHPKGDLYALGGLAFLMLTGRPPYEGKAADVLTRHVTDDPPKPTQIKPDLPKWADGLITELMAKNPEERPGAYQVVQLLEQATHRKLEAPKLLTVDAKGEVKRPSKAPYLVAAAGAALLTAGVLVLGMTLLTSAFFWAASRSPVGVAQEERDLAPTPGATMPEAPAPAPEVAPAAPTPKSAPAPGAKKPRPSSPGAAPAPEPPPAAAATTLKVRANRRVLVYVDGVAVGYTPVDHPVPLGAHEVAALVPGQPATRQAREVRVERDQSETVEFLF